MNIKEVKKAPNKVDILSNDFERALWSDFFGRKWDDFFERSWPSLTSSRVGTSLPAVNIQEDKSKYLFTLAVPGMKKEDFAIEVSKDNVLSISSKKERKHESKDEGYTRREFSYTSFFRSFHLPDAVDLKHIEAKYANGILSIHVPKKEEKAISNPVKKITIR